VTLLYTVGYEEAHFRRVFIIRGSLDGHHNNDLSKETLKLGPATIVPSILDFRYMTTQFQRLFDYGSIWVPKGSFK